MLLVEKHIIKSNDLRYKGLMDYLHKSKNLYNAATYSIRQYYFETKDNDEIKNKYLDYYSVDKLFKETHNPDYYSLPIDCSQQVLKQVNQNFKSFFALLKKKTEGKYEKEVKLPRYLDKNGYNVLTINYIKLGKDLRKKGIATIPNIKLKFRVINYSTCKQIRFVPKSGYIIMEVIYESQEQEMKQDNGRYMSVDLGINNLCTCTSNVIKSFIIDGKKIKSINQKWNKRKSYLQSRLDENKYISKQINSITRKRNFRIQNYLHTTSKILVNQAVLNDINTIIVGWNKEIKQEINIGTKNNQNFVQIPFYTLLNQIIYKAQYLGIRVIVQDESYTSKCSYYDNDYIPTYGVDDEKFNSSGKRIKRGLYRTSKGYIINADVNGSLNIMRKYFECNHDVSEMKPVDMGLVVNPERIKLLNV